MGSVLLSWLLLFLLFSGLGIGVLRVIGRSVDSGWLWLDCFWLGWALALGLMQFWHFVFPVNDALVLLFAAASVCLLLWRRRSLRRAAGRLAGDKPFLLLYALLALWMSNRALGMPIAFDTGFRDIQAVMWIDAYPIVPGLGNLFSSLAFNQSVYLYDALLDTSIWSGRSYYIATGLLLMVYLGYALGAALQFYRSPSAAGLRWSKMFAALTIPYILFQTVSGGGITHFLTDAVVDLMGFMTLIYLLDFLQEWRPAQAEGNYFLYRLAIVILAGITIKQSYFVYGAATAALAIMVWLGRGRLGEQSAERGAYRPIHLPAWAGAAATLAGPRRCHQRIPRLSAFVWQNRSGLDDAGGPDQTPPTEAGDQHPLERRRPGDRPGILGLAGPLGA